MRTIRGGHPVFRLAAGSSIMLEEAQRQALEPCPTRVTAMLSASSPSKRAQPWPRIPEGAEHLFPFNSVGEGFPANMDACITELPEAACFSPVHIGWSQLVCAARDARTPLPALN